jgi:hypothetical protein
MNGRALVLTALTLVTLSIAVFHPSLARAGLVGYWGFDGCTTTDASGNNASLAAQGNPSCVAGRFGNAWALNGNDQYLDRPSDPIFTPGVRSWSMAAWVKTSSAPSLSYVISWYRCGANPACTAAGDGAYYSLGVDAGHPFVEERDDLTSDLALTDFQSNVADGTWHFLAGTINSATDSLKLYVDGALRMALQGPISSLSSGGVPIPLEVGRLFRTGWGLPDYYFPGVIDEVRIFDNELSAASVAALFTSNATAAVSPRGATDLAIEEPAPNPARGGPLAVAFTLPSAEPASLAVFDVTGRLVSDRSVGALGAGRHLVYLGAGRGLAPGVYMLRLTQGASSVTRRVTRIQ